MNKLALNFDCVCKRVIRDFKKKKKKKKKKNQYFSIADLTKCLCDNNVHLLSIAQVQVR